MDTFGEVFQYEVETACVLCPNIVYINPSHAELFGKHKHVFVMTEMAKPV